MDHDEVIAHTRRWLAAMVIELNLCPFARRVFEAGRIRYVVSDVTGEAALREELARELRTLAAAPVAEVETTLLIHPHVCQDFLGYNDFLDVADGVIDELGLRGVIQVASFHPGYQFAGTAADAVENYTNRSPYPMLHLLREESITAAGEPDALLDIPRRNIETLRALGIREIRERLKALQGPR